MKPSEIGPWASDGGAKQMIKAGQLRYWDGQSPRNGQSFLVLRALESSTLDPQLSGKTIGKSCGMATRTAAGQVLSLKESVRLLTESNKLSIICPRLCPKWRK